MKNLSDIKEHISFLRKEANYLMTCGNELEQGREISIRLRKLTEQLETKTEVSECPKLQDVFERAFATWQLVNNKFK